MNNDAKKSPDAVDIERSVKFSQLYLNLIEDMYTDPQRPPTVAERSRADGFLAGVLSAARYFGDKG